MFLFFFLGKKLAGRNGQEETVGVDYLVYGGRSGSLSALLALNTRIGFLEVDECLSIR